MISGAATHDDTVAYARQHETIEFKSFGRTRWQVSPAGFGCYRVGSGVQSHFESMSKALSCGINVIDTSTNYADGGSEELVGQVLGKMIGDGKIRRSQVVVVSKAGYLQGRNYALSQERKAQAKPFPDLVPYGKGLEHCIHPEFLSDQLQRSLDRLQLETLDVLLLHNPEYFLDWSAKQGVHPTEARKVFYERIAKAFEYLEQEVSRGRIQCYGISSNTFPSPADHEDFVSLDRVWRIGQEISSDHHFHVVQLPMNLFEAGAIITANQADDRSVLQLAREEQLGVMINRPLNAFYGNRLIRLAEVSSAGRYSDDDIIQAINALNASEKTLWRKILPEMQLPGPLYQRIKDQAALGDHLKHYWRNFGSYDRWRQFRDGILLPRLQGVFDYMQQYGAHIDAAGTWLQKHRKNLESAMHAVESLYVTEAAREVKEIKRKLAEVDPVDWAGDKASLSQLAVRAVRSIPAVGTVLVGMRRPSYVDDICQELARPIQSSNPDSMWKKLNRLLTADSGQAPA